MKRTLVAAAIAACLLVAVAVPGAGAATVTATWKASYGAKGTATLSLLSSGAGTYKVSLKSVPASAAVMTSIGTGTCSKYSIVASMVGRSTSAGKFSKSRSVTSGGMSTILGATSLVSVVRVGSWLKCAALKGGPPVAAGSFGSGVKLVGTDVKAGTYRTRTAPDGCYWERLSGLGGTMDEIIANEIATGYAVVTIAPSDVAFDSSRCGTWSSDLSAVTASRTSFGEGTFIVGTDMQPGRYRSSEGDGCYWERLSGFGGTPDEIIANDIASGPGIVDIAPGDVGFRSSRCGTWSLVQ